MKLQDKYFPDGTALWAGRGLSGAQNAAIAIRAGRERFRHLDVAQLLKHMLGLSQCGRKWQLLLLWFAPDIHETLRMQTEIDRFTRLLDVDAHFFAARTYQDFWSELKEAVDSDHNHYRTYNDERYFALT